MTHRKQKKCKKWW